MSCACRFCFPDPPDWRVSYLAVLVCQDVRGLREELDGIEGDGLWIPGITCWCLACSRISVLSYNNYRLLVEQDGDRDDENDGPQHLDCVSYYVDLVIRYRMYGGRLPHFKRLERIANSGVAPAIPVE